MLPQVQSQTPLPTVITCTAAPYPRVEPFVQTFRVQTSKPVPIAPTRVQHAPSPTLDLSTNPWIEVIYNGKKNNPSIPTKPNPDLSLQVQHCLCCTLLNGGTSFCDQASHHLVADNMLNLPYDFHI